MGEDLRQRCHDALARALGECVNCGSPTALHCICGPYGTAAVLDRLTDAALAVRDGELEQVKDDTLGVVAEAAQEREGWRERAETAERDLADSMRHAARLTRINRRLELRIARARARAEEWAELAEPGDECAESIDRAIADCGRDVLAALDSQSPTLEPETPAGEEQASG